MGPQEPVMTSDFDADQAYVASFGELPRSLHVELDGTRLHLLEWGDPDAPPVLLVHGMRAHARWFTPVGPVLAQHHRVLAVDLRGHGYSAHTPPYGTGIYADDIAALVHALQLPKPILVGHSMGGSVAVLAATRLGPLLRGLIMIDAGLGPPPRPWPTPPGAPREAPERAGTPFRSYEQARARFKLRPGATTAAPELLEHLARHAIEARDDGTFRWRSDANLRRQAYVAPMPRLDGSSIRCPVMSIWGEHSPLLQRVDPRDIGERFPSAAFTAVEMVPNAYHHVFLDQPDACNAVLLRQLSAVP